MNKIDRREASTYSYDSGYAPTDIDQSTVAAAAKQPSEVDETLETVLKVTSEPEQLPAPTR
jgi:hypothetical protein